MNKKMTMVPQQTQSARQTCPRRRGLSLATVLALAGVFAARTSVLGQATDAHQWLVNITLVQE